MRGVWQENLRIMKEIEYESDDPDAMEARKKVRPPTRPCALRCILEHAAAVTVRIGLQPTAAALH